ncbi:decapping endonuclease targeting mRNA [Microbotryomycetes sp. JL201]|nr:decapping endonuclease targeting mRNA [Microbotryomycetes sp. JL201]
MSTQSCGDADEYDEPRRVKRQRVDTGRGDAPARVAGPSADAVQPHDTISSVNPASTWRVPSPSSPVNRAAAFQQPVHLTQFSYSSTRQLLNADDDSSNASLGWLADERKWLPQAPSSRLDLNKGFEECIWRDESVDEGLDALLDTLDKWHKRDQTGFAKDCLDRNKVFTWRGMMTRLMLASYDSVDDRALGWEMNAMMMDDALYLEDANSPAKLAAKASSEASSKRFAYHGIAFEGHMVSHSTSNPGPNNTNVQWCSIVKTNLDGHRMILGGEVDCIRPRPFTHATNGHFKVSTNDFVELKTNMIIKNERDEVNFEKNKLIKHFAQSFLLGVPTVIVGFRDRSGILTTVQEFKTLELPRLVRGKPHAWDKNVLLSTSSKILSFVTETISSSNPMHDKNQRFLKHVDRNQNDKNDIDNDDDKATFDHWPVFRIKFDSKSAIFHKLNQMDYTSPILEVKRSHPP